jgi:non-ribosomal peptide synthetase component E (peptide arylation enzyme)
VTGDDVRVDDGDDVTVKGPLLGAIVKEAAARYADTPLYVTPEGTTLSYAELDDLSDAVAAGLTRRGIREGDLVGLLLPSGASYAVAYVAAA